MPLNARDFVVSSDDPLLELLEDDGGLYIPGSVNKLTLRLTFFVSISTTCLIDGLWFETACVQKSATVIKRIASSSGQSVKSGSTTSRSLSASLSFHAYKKVFQTQIHIFIFLLQKKSPKKQEIAARFYFIHCPTMNLTM